VQFVCLLPQYGLLSKASGAAIDGISSSG